VRNLHRNLGLFHERTGNLEEAKKELHSLLVLAPNDADTQKALAALERIRKAQFR
jgi:Flp pilus assembly protein TadD